MMDDHKIYTCKDGRLRVYLKESKRVISYPRFLMEQKLGRELKPNEQIHHIDGDPLNNNLDNLEIRLLGDHQREHNPSKYRDKIVSCEWCGKEFIWTAKQQRNFYINKRRRHSDNDNPFCSKKCVGAYGRHIQSNS